VKFQDISVISCKKDKDTEIIKMRVNHYVQPAVSIFYYGFALIVQQDDKIGSNDWTGFEKNIAGFEFAPGYVYNLEVEKKQIENPPMDGSSIAYTLKSILSKTKVPQETTFEIFLSRKFGNGFISYITKDESSNYKLLNSASIDCGTFCDDMAKDLKAKKEITAVCKHLDGNSIQLISIKVN
jgi:hypothetical protein